MSQQDSTGPEGGQSNNNDYIRHGTDDVFCLEDLQIPPDLPSILKQYTKDAIRTQPRDILLWSFHYFRAKSRGEMPPVKERLEYPEISSSGLTKGILQSLNKQLKGQKEWSKKEIANAWTGHCLDMKFLKEFFMILDPTGEAEKFEWNKVFALAAGTLGRNLTETMKIICEVLTDQPDGAEALILFRDWWGLYLFLACEMGNVTREQVEDVLVYLEPIARANNNMISPKNFLHQNCPSLY